MIKTEQEGIKEQRFLNKESNQLWEEFHLAVESVGELKEENRQAIRVATDLATNLHKDQKPRPDGPYINHVLRVSTRLISEYGVYDPELIISAVLHDVVEDQSVKLVGGDDELVNQEGALAILGERFGERVAQTVKQLTTPEHPKELSRAERNQLYYEHLLEVIENPDSVLIKLSDFSDNALRLHVVTDPKRQKSLAKKYLPVFDLFLERMQRGDLPISREKQQEIVQTLVSAKEKCEELT